jgi:hypothetical protein
MRNYGKTIPFYNQSMRFVQTVGPLVDGKLSGTAAGQKFTKVRVGFSRLDPHMQQKILAGGLAASALGVSGVVRVVRYKNPNVKIARAVRRSNASARQVEGIRAGLKVRATGFRAGSLRSRSDRIYNRAGAAEDLLAKKTGLKKQKGQKRLRIKSIPAPTGGVKSSAKFYAKTSYAAGATRGAAVGVRSIRKRPTKPIFTAKTAVRAGVLRGRSDRLRYKAGKATARNKNAISARNQKAVARASQGSRQSRSNFRVRRDGNGRFAGSY